MKHKMTFGFVMLLATAASGMVATAGTKTHKPISVNIQPDGSGEASGVPGSVRGSGDSLARIGCWSYAYLGWTQIATTCYASDENGVQASCYTYDPVLQTLLRAPSDASFRFIWAPGGYCTFVEIDTGSEWAPKQP
jgi:hypothetical protein